MTCSTSHKEAIYYRTDGLGHGPTIRSIFLADPSFPRRLNAEFIRQRFADDSATGRTCFEGIGQHEPESPLDSLEGYIDSFAGQDVRDTRLGLAWLQGSGDSLPFASFSANDWRSIPVFAPSRSKHPRATSPSNLTWVDASDIQLISALPNTVSSIEAPIDTWLPVVATLVARSMKQAGIDQAIVIHHQSVKRGSIASIFRSMGIHAHSLYHDAPQDPEPVIDISCYHQPELYQRLATDLGIPLVPATPRQLFFQVTLCLLHAQMTGQLLKERFKTRR